jgi:histidine ammonia-lyase
METMAAARHQIEHQLSTLQAIQRQLRQEEITAEIIELAAGETASNAESGMTNQRSYAARCSPPSTGITVPVIRRAASLTRNAARLPTSAISTR